MTGLAIAGAGLGLFLGKSAISEINPAYFSSAFSGSTFHSDLVANRPAFDDRAPLLETADALVGFGSGCVGCRTYPEEYYPIHDPAVDSFSGYASVRTPAAEIIMADAERYITERPSAEELKNVERYAHYRVAQDEEQPAPAEEAAQADVESEDCADAAQCESAPEPAA